LELEKNLRKMGLFKMETKIINWINKRIKESEDLLIDTDYLSVINEKQKVENWEDRENNNFEAGVICGLKELKKELKA